MHLSFSPIDTYKKLCVLRESINSWWIQLSALHSTFIVEHPSVPVIMCIDISGNSSFIFHLTSYSSPILASLHLYSPTSIRKICFTGFIDPLPPPQGVFSDISMDFIVGLPRSQGKEVNFTVVDCLTKYGHFMALGQPYTASQVAEVFM